MNYMTIPKDSKTYKVISKYKVWGNVLKVLMCIIESILFLRPNGLTHLKSIA